MSIRKISPPNTRSWVAYFLLGLVGIVSITTSVFWVDGLVRSSAGVALFVALAGFVVQFVRDDAAHKREIEKADRTNERLLINKDLENKFTLGISSHMAKIAFDKHVLFCEEYAAAADKALNDIFKSGPAPDALVGAGNLLAVRRKHAVWITEEVDAKLNKFEQLFVEMGASAGYVDATRGAPSSESRQDHINRMYKHFSTLTGAGEWQGEKLDQGSAVISTIHWLRKILGTEELNAMRQSFVGIAVSELAEVAGHTASTLTTSATQSNG